MFAIAIQSKADQVTSLRYYNITTPASTLPSTLPFNHLHLISSPRVLLPGMLDIRCFDAGLLPRRLVALRPVDVALCKLHLGKCQ